MGGYSGEVRGSTKIETYLRYVEKCEEWELDHSPEPKNKKFCKKSMIWDQSKAEWVLEFRFSK
jgi:hypothetical protein